MAKKLEFFIIGETYIKFNLEYTERSKVLIREAYYTQIGSRSRELLKNKGIYKISIEFDEGSTKTKIIIWATAIVSVPNLRQK